MQYYPRVKNHIKRLVVYIIRFLKKKLKKSKKPYYVKKIRQSICKQCNNNFNWETIVPITVNYNPKSYVKNFCGNDCRILFKQEIERRRKERNLAAWGTEERPDEATRKIITRKKQREWDKTKKQTDPAYRLIKRMRTRTRKVLKGIYKEGKVWNGKKLSIFEKLCVTSGEELREHIEAQWQEGMSWENYYEDRKGWVIDHHIPIAFYKNNFDLLNDLEIQKKAFGKDNLKPMWWVDNAHKSAKLDYDASRPRKN